MNTNLENPCVTNLHHDLGIQSRMPDRVEPTKEDKIKRYAEDYTGDVWGFLNETIDDYDNETIVEHLQTSSDVNDIGRCAVELFRESVQKDAEIKILSKKNFEDNENKDAKIRLLTAQLEESIKNFNDLARITKPRI